MTFHEPPSTYVSRLTLKVSNLEQSILFYKQVLGFKIIELLPDRAHLGVGDSKRLLTLERPQNVMPLQTRTTGLYHFAILLPERTDLAQITAHLTNKRIRFGSSDHLVSEALYLSDPDGNGIEIYRDRPDEEWSWHGNQVAMTVDPLDFSELMANAPEEDWSEMPAETIIGHIHLHVSELSQSERFYCDGLGFEVVNRYGSQALFLSSGKYHHHIGVNTWQGVGAPIPHPNSVGLAHFTVAYPDEKTRDQTIEQLKKIDAPLTKMEEGFRAIDPSGNTILIDIHNEGR